MADDHPPLSPYVPGTPEALDAVIAAPASHEVVFENASVRTLRVIVRAGEAVEKHSHRCQRVFIIGKRPKIKYFAVDGGEVPIEGGPPPGEPMWLGPEGVHWVENPGDFDFEAIRVEFKK